MGIVTAIGSARERGAEAAKRIPTGSEAREKTMQVIDSALQTCKGSGHLMTEVGNVGKACIELPMGIASNTMKACTNFVTGHPVDAFCSATEILTDSCKKAGKIMAFTTAGSNAALQEVGRGARSVARIPGRAARTVSGGLNRISNMAFGNTPTGPSGGNAGLSSADAPPPPSADSGKMAT